MNAPSPETFADALVALDSLVPAATKQYLLALDETGLEREHWGLGLAVRNVLGLWRDDAPLTRWFESRGIVQPDDMSSAILRAYWRRLRGFAPGPEPSGGPSVVRAEDAVLHPSTVAVEERV
jgi:hypothetical protein